MKDEDALSFLLKEILTTFELVITTFEISGEK
jgi:hypothetical protein